MEQRMCCPHSIVVKTLYCSLAHIRCYVDYVYDTYIPISLVHPCVCTTLDVQYMSIVKVVGTSSCNCLLYVQQVKHHHGYSLSGTSLLSLALSWRQTM